MVELTINQNKGKMKKIKKRKWFSDKVQHGLLMYGITNRLAKKGIEIRPYYWEREYISEHNEPKINGNPDEYSIKYLGPNEIKEICASGKGYNLSEKLEKLKNGQICIGLFHDDNIVAYSWIELNTLNFRNRKIHLKENESYLGGMFTIEAYRGKNLAAFLRYQVYEILKNKGVNTIYSISDYFNYPAIKFKKKLKSEHLKLYFYIGLFNRFHWNYQLRKYS